MRIEIDIRSMEKAVQRTRNALKEVQEKNDKLTKKFIKEANENLKYIATTAIDKFYESYEPHYYGRTLDLYNTYQITVREDEWKVDFSSSFMQEWHRVDAKDPEYIFENSFMRGWHGGAISGENHPNPGTPYWKVPVASLWTADGGWTPAIKSPSPYQEIVRKSNAYMELEIGNYAEEYNKNIDKFLRQMKWNLERIR